VFLIPMKTDSHEKNQYASCETEEVLSALNEIPEGLMFASNNMAGPILINTSHRVMSGNYHRNWEGISASIKINISKPDVAYDHLIKHNVDYVLFCKSEIKPVYVETYADGLLMQISSGAVPDYLRSIEAFSPTVPEDKKGDIALYEVVRK